MRNLILLFFFFNFNFCFGQNLVPNPSFEDTVHCPNANNAGTIQAKYWFGVYDSVFAYYFNACSSPQEFGVPLNQGTGFQYAKDGDAYAGIINGSNFPFRKEFRYYVQTKLLDTLSKGKKYKVSFYTSLMDSSWYRCSEIQAYLAPVGIFKNSDSTIIGVTPQISNNSITNQLNSFTNWTLISDTFTAKGNETWIIIGNFKDYFQTKCDTNFIGNFHWTQAQYYLDNISVIENKEDGIETIPIINANLYPNPTTDFISIKLSDWLATPNEVIVFFEQGYEVWKQQNLKEKEFRVNLANLSTGIYILQLKNHQHVITKKIIKL